MNCHIRWWSGSFTSLSIKQNESYMKVNAQIITLCLSLLTACNPMKEAEEEADCLPDIFPDYTSIVIPYNIAPLG